MKNGIMKIPPVAGKGCHRDPRPLQQLLQKRLECRLLFMVDIHRHIADAMFREKGVECLHRHIIGHIKLCLSTVRSGNHCALVRKRRHDLKLSAAQLYFASHRRRCPDIGRIRTRSKDIVTRGKFLRYKCPFHDNALRHRIVQHQSFHPHHDADIFPALPQLLVTGHPVRIPRHDLLLRHAVFILFLKRIHDWCTHRFIRIQRHFHGTHRPHIRHGRMLCERLQMLCRDAPACRIVTLQSRCGGCILQPIIAQGQPVHILVLIIAGLLRPDTAQDTQGQQQRKDCQQRLPFLSRQSGNRHPPDGGATPSPPVVLLSRSAFHKPHRRGRTAHPHPPKRQHTSRQRSQPGKKRPRRQRPDAEKPDCRVLLHPDHHIGSHRHMQQKAQPPPRHYRRHEIKGHLLHGQHPDLPRRHAQTFDSSIETDILSRRNPHDIVDHQHAAQHHDQIHLVKTHCRTVREFPFYLVIGQIGRIGDRLQSHTIKHIPCLFLQISRPVQRYAKRCPRKRIGTQRLRRLLRDPRTGFRLPHQTFPPSAQTKPVRPLCPAVRRLPAKHHLRPDLMRNGQRIHGKLIQRDLPLLFRHPPHKRHRFRGLRPPF